MLNPGDKLLVSHRRLFEKDDARCFVGEVRAYTEGVVKVRGYSFVRDFMGGKFLRKDDLRTKLLSLSSAGYIVYQLPAETDVSSVAFSHEGSDLILTDGKSLRMNMAEFPHRGQI